MVSLPDIITVITRFTFITGAIAIMWEAAVTGMEAAAITIIDTGIAIIIKPALIIGLAF